MYKILVVEDDTMMAKTLKEHLEKWNYEVQVIEDFRSVMESFLSFDPQLVLMDIHLPFYDGFHWCTEIRRVSQVPMIFLSSASDNMNIVMAMSMGADEFIEKPYNLQVLTAKIQALLRRTYAFQGHGNVMEHGGVLLNLSDATILSGDQKLELTKNEFRIMKQLLEHAGKIVSRDEIIENLWENDAFIDDNTLTVNVTRLRKKLEDSGINGYIKTKKGIGYIIE